MRRAPTAGFASASFTGVVGIIKNLLGLLFLLATGAIIVGRVVLDRARNDGCNVGSPADAVECIRDEILP